jgi:tight adherence protein C
MEPIRTILLSLRSGLMEVPRHILIPALVGVICFLLLMTIWQYLQVSQKKRRQVSRILEGDGQESLADEADSIRQTGRRAINPFLNLLKRLGEKVAPKKSEEYHQTKMKFQRAGLHRKHDPTAFWGIKALLTISLPLGFLLNQSDSLTLAGVNSTLFFCLSLAGLGFYMPDIWLRLKIARRKRKIAEALPDALDLLVICVEAGMGLDAAIQRVGEEIRLRSGVLSDELKLLNQEVRMGESRQAALRNLSQRTDLDAVKSLASLLIQTERFGTSLARALRVYADSFRTQRFQRAEEMAAKLPVKLMFPLILFIFPALFIAILGPAVVRVLELFPGLNPFGPG